MAPLFMIDLKESIDVDCKQTQTIVAAVCCYSNSWNYERLISLFVCRSRIFHCILQSDQNELWSFSQIHGICRIYHPRFWIATELFRRRNRPDIWMLINGSKNILQCRQCDRKLFDILVAHFFNLISGVGHCFQICLWPIIGTQISRRDQDFRKEC